MFTGLIEEIGTLQGVRQQGEALVLAIGASKVLEGVQLGDSIAINGVCLTVISFTGSSFSVDVVPQTYRHTNLGTLQNGQPVNLERAMAANGRFGGHIVQGHVDGIGIIRARESEGNAVIFQIEPAEDRLMRHVIPQGSVTLDGISLTVAKAAGNRFSVSIIPHTLQETALQWKRAGDTVNIETDILGKYVDHLLGMGRADQGVSSKGKMTTAFLSEHGFL
ncbi:riboflavin synthase [Paenibacillus sp. GCM10012307]|uniref:Riboflavin synthase n=1 Tax=Paenibacillus roseus TaxID=2798579 RepID=A0A934JA74_9BACL|nr:riboflavin synthase [Paenibacillus roseus]MBJ6363471.1 riboflavin synthase [Paenibacillus roseus]